MLSFVHDGLRFNYVARGEGMAVLFQHGLGSDARQIDSLFQAPLQFRLLSMDFRGHGDTRPLGSIEKIGMFSFADDLIEFMDRLAIRQAVIGGISMGAAVALNLALRFPERVSGLILSRACWLDCPLPPNAQVFVAIGRHIRAYGAKRGRELFGQSEDYREILDRSQYFGQSLLSLFDGSRAEETAVKFERIANDAPFRNLDDLAGVRVPTLVMANRNDPVHPFEYGEVLARVIPGARLCEIAAKSDGESRHAADVQRWMNEFLKTTFGSPT